MKPVEYDSRELQRHIAGTYVGLRIGIAVIGAALPLLLWVGGVLREHLALKASMSAYYYTAMRDVFVGSLVSVGVFLYLYKGFSRRENWALNIAGLMAVIVAFLPTRALSEDTSTRSVIHNTAAATLFLCIAYVSIFRGDDTLSLIAGTSVKRAKRLRAVYRILGGAMLASPAVAIALSFAFNPRDPRASLIFFVEAAGVWAFAAYWYFKSREVAETEADLVALQGNLQAVPAEATHAAPVGKMARLA